MARNEQASITLKILAQDLASGKVGAFIGKVDTLAKRGGIMGSIFQGVGQSFGQTLNPMALVSRGLGAVTDTIGDAVGAASDLEESQSKVEQVFTDSADTIRDWATDSASAFGISEAAALEAAGTFGNFIQALGNTEDEANKMSRSIVELAADLASFNNQDIDDVIVALRSGLAGEAEPMRRLGVSISAARVEANLLAKGIVRTKSEITDAMKVSERYAIIMEDTSKAQGDFARTSDGLANSQRQQAAEMENAMASLGRILLPLATNLTQFTADVIPQIVGGIEALGNAFNDLNRFLDPNLALQQDIAALVPDVAEAMGVEAGAVDRYRESVQRATEMDERRREEQEQMRSLIENNIAAFDGMVGMQEGSVDVLAELLGLEESFVEQVLKSNPAVVDRAASLLRYRDSYEGTNEVVEDAIALERQLVESYATGARALGQLAAVGPTVTAQMRDMGAAASGLIPSLPGAGMGREIRAVFSSIATQADRQRAEQLDEAIDHIANVSFADLKDAAKEARQAIKAAFSDQAKPLKQLISEEERLEKQRRRALRQGEFDAAAIIDARLGVVQQQIDERKTANKHYRAEAKEQKARREDIGKIAKALDITRGEARDLWKQTNADYTIDMLVNDKQLDAARIKVENLLALASGAASRFLTNFTLGGKKGPPQHTGNAFIPETGNYFLERGERVVSAADNKAGKGGGGATVNIYGGYFGTDMRTVARDMTPHLAREMRSQGLMSK